MTNFFKIYIELVIIKNSIKNQSNFIIEKYKIKIVFIIKKIGLMGFNYG